MYIKIRITKNVNNILTYVFIAFISTKHINDKHD